MRRKYLLLILSLSLAATAAFGQAPEGQTFGALIVYFPSSFERVVSVDLEVDGVLAATLHPGEDVIVYLTPNRYHSYRLRVSQIKDGKAHPLWLGAPEIWVYVEPFAFEERTVADFILDYGRPVLGLRLEDNFADASPSDPPVPYVSEHYSYHRSWDIVFFGVPGIGFAESFTPAELRSFCVAGFWSEPLNDGVTVLRPGLTAVVDENLARVLFGPELGIRSTNLDLRFGVLLRLLTTDRSSELPDYSRPGFSPIHSLLVPTVTLGLTLPLYITHAFDMLIGIHGTYLFDVSRGNGLEDWGLDDLQLNGRLALSLELSWDIDF